MINQEIKNINQRNIAYKSTILALIFIIITILLIASPINGKIYAAVNNNENKTNKEKSNKKTNKKIAKSTVIKGDKEDIHNNKISKNNKTENNNNKKSKNITNKNPKNKVKIEKNNKNRQKALKNKINEKRINKAKNKKLPQKKFIAKKTNKNQENNQEKEEKENNQNDKNTLNATLGKLNKNNKKKQNNKVIIDEDKIDEINEAIKNNDKDRKTNILNTKNKDDGKESKKDTKNNDINKINEKNNALSINSIFFNEEEMSIDGQENYKTLEISLSNYTSKNQKHRDNFQISTLSNPSRLVIDIKNANFKDPQYKPIIPNFVKNYRFNNDDNWLRIVFELSEDFVIIKKSLKDFGNQNLQKIIVEFTSRSSIKNNNKISDKSSKKGDNDEEKTNNNAESLINQTIASQSADSQYQANDYSDLSLSTKEILQMIGKQNRSSSNKKNNEIQNINNSSNQQNKLSTNKNNKKSNKKFVIVIDAGHGGKDPGTIGNILKIKEKDLTLDYATNLKKILERNPKYKVILTRDSDFFIPLKDRVAIARKAKADLFISLHINWNDNAETKGFSIYTLSEKSSDKQAELLAQKENRSDIISGIDFDGASKDIVNTLIAMSQRSSMNSSSEFANLAVRIAKKNQIKVLQNSHRFAGFAVLTAPDMASVLAEIGYVSNKEEEELLIDKEYSTKIINSMAEAIDEYFSKSSNF